MSQLKCFNGFSCSLFLLFILFYGCSEKKPTVKLENTPDSPTVVKEESEKTSQPALSNERIAELLGGATTEFTETFQDKQNTEKSKDTKLNVDPKLKEKYIKDTTPVMVPELEAGSPSSTAEGVQKWQLVYKFIPGETLRWSVLHKVYKKLTYGGETKAIETISRTVRRWTMGEMTPEKKYRCEHLIEQMILYQKEDGKDAVSYDSTTDKTVPKVFSVFGVEKTVGKILERFEIDSLGLMTSKEKLVREFHGMETDSKVLVPFPRQSVAIGDSWTIPYTIYLKGRDGTIRSYQATQKFTLDKVQGRLAIIRFRTIMLSIVTDPAVEGQLAEKLFNGQCRFDMESGRPLETELNFAKSVPNAMGDASHLDYTCTMIEKLVREEEKK